MQQQDPGNLIKPVPAALETATLSDSTPPPQSPAVRPMIGQAERPPMWLGWLAACVLMALYAAMALSSIQHKSPTFDEHLHLASGYSYWLYNDYRLHPENGNLPQRWLALPLYVLRDQFRFAEHDAEWTLSQQWLVAHHTFYERGNDAAYMLWLGRAMNVPVGMAVLALIYGWSRSLFGAAGGMLSLTLAAFCPNLLAHGRLATSDMFATLTFLAAAGAVWATLQTINARTLLIGAAACAALALSKFSAVLLLPMAIGMVLVRVLRRRSLPVNLPGWKTDYAPGSRQVAAIALAGLIQGLLTYGVVWAAYGTRFSMFHPADPHPHRPFRPWETMIDEIGALGPILQSALDLRLLPEAFLHGFTFVLYHARRPEFFCGDFRFDGWATFFPFCVAVKTPLGTLLIIAMAALALLMLGRGDGAGADGGASAPADPAHVGKPRFDAALVLYRAAPLLILLLIYWFTSITSTLNIGLRHVLPTFPPTFILAGAAAGWLRGRGRIVAKCLITAALAWVIGASLWIHPHYLAYFNELIGPGNGYHYLVDSSLDWGQDLPALRKYLEQRGLNRSIIDADDAEPVFFSYFGSADPPKEGIRVPIIHSHFNWYRENPDRRIFPFTGGLYIFSVTMFQNVYSYPYRPWFATAEKHYWELREKVEPAFNPELTQEQRNVYLSDTRWQDNFKQLEQYELTRLCHYLRAVRPEPDAMLDGYTLIVFRLTDEQVRAALFGPATWIVPDPPITLPAPTP